jgi:hypothetical protein
MRCAFVLGSFLLAVGPLTLPEEGKPLTAPEARKKVGETVTVEMKVQAAKDRLEKRGEIYLDAEPDFRDPQNFAVVITKAGAASLKAAGIDNPADHFRDKALLCNRRPCPRHESSTDRRSTSSS